MAMSWTKNDVYQIVNEVVSQTMGSQTDLVAFDTESFAMVGSKLLGYSTEKTLNAITQMFAKTIFSVRPYKSKFEILEVDNRLWGAVTRKIQPLYKGLEQSQDNNTDLTVLDPNLQTGKSTDPWEQNLPEVTETCFVGVNTIQKSLTNLTQDQLNVAFSNEDEFGAFLFMIAEAFQNEIEKARETMKRMVVLNHIGACYKTNMYVDLALEFNKAFETSHTREQLLTTYFENFMKFSVAYIKKLSNLFTEFSFKYHQKIAGDEVPRHTPKSEQRMIFFEPFFIDARAFVFSSIFNPEELDIGSYEKVNYWQNINHESSVLVKPTYLDEDGKQTTDDDPVSIPFVLGLLFDKDAMGWTNIFKATVTSPLNVRGMYYNTVYHEQTKGWNDMSENCCLFVIGEGGDVPSIALDKSTATATVGGETVTITATTTPAASTVTWESSNEDVATVEDGVVTPVGAGTCTITASITEGYDTLTATCTVTVSAENKKKK
ncbi:MAG: Ig-like domain-containing protein [Methanobrevibacter sp.]|nr:Ig-like domain-containing protein [Methanobrevibacter sp.]